MGQPVPFIPDLPSRDAQGLRQANERLQAFNDVLLAQTEVLLEQREELRAAYWDVARMNEAKDELLGLVSHELRTPLAVIRNGLTILDKQHAGPLNAYQARFVRLGLDAASNLGCILDEILDWQKLMAGKALCEAGPADLREVVLQAAGSQRALFAEKDIDFLCEPGELPMPGSFDPARIGQVIQNLLSNAAKFTPAGGRVHLTAAARPGEIGFTVTDTGCGIPPCDRARIFEPFVQLDAGLTRAVGGTGLGLAICKKIVESGHGGRIWARGADDGGAVLEVTLPVVSCATEVN